LKNAITVFFISHLTKEALPMRKNAGMIPKEAQAFGLGLAGCDTGTGGPPVTPDTPPANVSGLRGIVGNKRVMLSWNDPADADLAAIEITWTGGSTSVAKGTRTATITGLTNGIGYTFTVKAKDRAGNRSGGVPSGALTPFVVNDIAAELATPTHGTGTVDDPIILPVNLDLASGSAWTDLLTAIQTANEFVALDLSSCTMSGAEFDPNAAAPSGETKVVSLVLPDVAASIKAGTSSDPTFKNFTALTSVSGAQVETVGEYAFDYCTSLETVSLPKATTIGGNAFSFCTSLETVSLPKATTIGDLAFLRCTSLETIDLPATMTTIERNPFAGCTKLTTIRVAAGNPNYKSENGKLLNKAGNTLIAYPTVAATVTLSSPITTIGPGAFFYCTSLETVSLPAATTIGEMAFGACVSLETLSLPNATTIGEEAFSFCMFLKTLNLPKATSIGESAFASCDSLETVNLPAATTIGDWAFRFCSSLQTLHLPAAPPALGGVVFENAPTGTLTIHVPSVAAYTTAWGVDVDTAAKGNEARYGDNHKRIVITAP
jgi:hypothetical protein